jgi:hypothetical protein
VAAVALWDSFPDWNEGNMTGVLNTDLRHLRRRDGSIDSCGRCAALEEKK